MTSVATEINETSILVAPPTNVALYAVAGAAVGVAIVGVAFFLPRGRTSGAEAGPEVQLGFFGGLTAFSYRLFRPLADRLAQSIPGLREDLLKSDMTVTAEGLLAFTFLATVISLAVAAGLAAAFLAVGFPLGALVLLAPLFVFLISINLPKLSASSRSSRMDDELPFVVGFLAILAGGGQTLVDTFRRISKMKDLFPAASKEAARIITDIDVNAMEPVAAMDRAGKYNPNRWFSELLSGYSTVLRTGGDYVTYLDQKLQQVFEERASRIKRSADSTGSIAETYMIVVVVLGIVVFTLYLVQAFVSSSTAGLTNVLFFAFIIVPIVSAGFIWLLDGSQPKWPYTDYRPYKAFGICMPIGAAFFFIPLPLLLFQHLSVSLLIVSLPAAYFAWKYGRERRAIERRLPEFIADVADGRKVGLSPEGAIERLYERPYGPLSNPVQKMASQLTWGISLKKVLTSFAASVKSWVGKAVGTLMLEVIEQGGGTVKGFAEMADFTRKTSTMEDERRSSLRGYIFVAYISAIMIISTTFIFVYFVGASNTVGLGGASAGIYIAPSTVDLLFASSAFEAWVIGLVSGKMGESSLAAGFKHASIMIFITLATVYIVGFFLPVNV